MAAATCRARTTRPARGRPRGRAAAAGPLLVAAILCLAPTAPARATAGTVAVAPPYLDPALPVAQRVADLLGRMTLREKVGQMTQAEQQAVDGDPAVITQLGLGSVLSGGGSVPTPNSATAWADMVDRYQRHALQTRLAIPLLYGVDAVHGHGNLRGATVFPHNIGMGATRDPGLVTWAAQITAVETRATGVPWTFSPCLCVARDIRWGRTYESFGETPGLVARMAASIEGYQGSTPAELRQPGRVLATAKHFAGDGDTEYVRPADPAAYPIDRGVVVSDLATFERVNLAPYVSAVREHGVGSIMPSFSSVDWVEDGVGNPLKMHANRALLQGWLKDRIGFDGFLVSDWDGIDEIPGDRASDVRTWVNAGGDMAMEPHDFREFVATLVSEVQAGRVPVARVDDAVRRILTKKFQLGLFEQPFADRRNVGRIGSAGHRAVARRAASASQVLLKNDGGVLPLDGDERIYVAGRNADDLGNQMGGWTITWQGQPGRWTDGTTILGGMREVAPGATITYSKDASAPTAGHDVGVVVVGETPYSEYYGDVGGPRWRWDPVDGGVPREPKLLTLQPGDRTVVDRVCTAVPTCVVLIVSGRPLVVTDQLPRMDALVASWLPGSEGGGVADVLFGRMPFTGRLPQTWPRTEDQVPINVGDVGYDPLFPFGWGLRTLGAPK